MYGNTFKSKKKQHVEICAKIKMTVFTNVKNAIKEIINSIVVLEMFND